MATTTRKPSVFISYRRDDSGGWAGRLEDELADRFGSQRVFRDVRIPAGVDYERHIESVLDACHVVVVVIGPTWATLTGPDGGLRLSQPDDLLRREIERALLRHDVEVIPVLVQRARMPAARELPVGLQALARRQAIELSDSRWDHDIELLVAQLCEALEGTSAVHAPPPPPAPPRPTAEPPELTGRERLMAAAALVVAAALGVMVASAFTAGLAEQRHIGAPQLDRFVYYSAERAVIWGIVGAAVLAVAAATLRGERASAVGWAIVGLCYGAIGGALSGAAYMLLKDQGVLGGENMLHGISTAIAGAVLAAALAKLVSVEPSIYRLAGLAGGLLGGILAQQWFFDPHSTQATGMVVCEAIVTMIALAAVATPPSTAFAGRPRSLSKT
jgi:TIR domain